MDTRERGRIVVAPVSPRSSPLCSAPVLTSTAILRAPGGCSDTVRAWWGGAATDALTVVAVPLTPSPPGAAIPHVPSQSLQAKRWHRDLLCSFLTTPQRPRASRLESHQLPPVQILGLAHGRAQLPACTSWATKPICSLPPPIAVALKVSCSSSSGIARVRKR